DNACALDSIIHLSYSGYNLSDLKEENPSSMLFELYKKQRGENATTKELENEIGAQHKYFDENISSLKDVGRYYLDDFSLEPQDTSKEECVSSSKVNYTISPSAADVFFTCPRRFYLTKILGIVEPETDNPFKTIPENDEGTLVHECMEDYGNNPNWTKKEFMNNADTKFENYFNKRIPLHNKDKEMLKREYLRMVEIGYDNDPDNKEVIASEKYLGPYLDPITGLSFGGIVDRLEKLSNGKYRIVDYKTYKEKKNNEGDIDTCFQVALYAYILENDIKDPKAIEDCEYRYLRNPMVVKANYQDIKGKLENKLKEIKNALDSGDFPFTDDTKNCDYCKLKDICGINQEAKSNG
ncbi:MAG: PD-(D/E)XK nuclease family protein, partial [Firmicutes bacterium]|nr:PD-(D/E)XK nuclease family protein [Candidatus Colivicinus equi]